MSEWRLISNPPRNTDEDNPVDLWIHVNPSPLSMGMGDSWRIPDCWRVGGKWVHRHKNEIKELAVHYLTHWIRPPKPPTFKRERQKVKK